MTSSSLNAVGVVAGFSSEQFEIQLLQFLQSARNLSFNPNTAAQNATTTFVTIQFDSSIPELYEGFPFSNISQARLKEITEEVCERVSESGNPGSMDITFGAQHIFDIVSYFGLPEGADFDQAVMSGQISLAELNEAAALSGNFFAANPTPLVWNFDLYAGATSGVRGDTSDFDGDGFDDVLFFNSVSNSVGQYEMPSGDWDVIGTAGSNWEVRGTGNFDFDFNTDVLWFNTATRAVGRFDMEAGQSVGWQGMGNAGVGWEVIGTGDFNGDQLDDILWYNSITRKLGQYEVDANGNTSWSGLGGVGSGWEVVSTGDIAVGSIDDLIFYNAGTGALGILETGFLNWGGLGTVGSGYVPIETADFTGDGHDELLVYNESARSLGYYEISYNGFLTRSWVNLGNHGEGWSIEGTLDLDGTGRDDILWRHDDGRVGAYLMDGPTRVWDAVGFASSDWDIVL